MCRHPSGIRWYCRTGGCAGGRSWIGGYRAVNVCGLNAEAYVV
jgi:hypothetical protein